MQFRQYLSNNNPIQEFYKTQRSTHTIHFVKYLQSKYHSFSHKISIQNCFNALNNLIDISDPDINLPNIHHLLQTAQAIRNDGHPDWLQLVGLIHDLGKIIYLKGCNEDGTSMNQQWSIVGDTFVVGCKLPDNIVYKEFNQLNPDMQDDRYNTEYGIYHPNCGLDNCYISYGHDEYLYQVLKFNNCTIPEKGLYMIRYHSLYPWHKYNEYEHLMNDKDREYKKWVQLFNQYDLYTKENIEMNVEELMKYYQPIIEKYIGNHIFI